MGDHIFISYSRVDREYAERLVAHLTAAGLPVWVDHNLDYGDRWGTVIRERIDSCAVFMPIMTPDADGSPWVAREIIRAEAKGKLIIPLLLAGEVFFRLADMQYEDVRGAAMPSPSFVSRLKDMARQRPNEPRSVGGSAYF